MPPKKKCKLTSKKVSNIDNSLLCHYDNQSTSDASHLSCGSKQRKSCTQQQSSTMHIENQDGDATRGTPTSTVIPPLIDRNSTGRTGSGHRKKTQISSLREISGEFKKTYTLPLTGFKSEHQLTNNAIELPSSANAVVFQHKKTLVSNQTPLSSTFNDDVIDSNVRSKKKNTRDTVRVDYHDRSGRIDYRLSRQRTDNRQRDRQIDARDRNARTDDRVPRERVYSRDQLTRTDDRVPTKRIDERVRSDRTDFRRRNNRRNQSTQVTPTTTIRRSVRLANSENLSRVRYSNDRRNKSFEVPGGRIFESPGTRKNLCFTPNQLATLEQEGMPEPPSAEQLVEVTERIYDRFHEENVTCAVCNQFVRIGTAKFLTENNVPPKFFDLLQAPDGSCCPSLHPTLVQQYDVSTLFPQQSRFKNVLLSPDGVLQHSLKCKNNENCSCKPHLYICDHTGMRSCFKQLKAGKLPKFSIANGNWVGQLPPDLANLSYGSRSIMRPVQTFGRIVAFSGNSGPGGSSLKGHVYSTRLKTAFVRKKLPIAPSQTPVRVLVVSPFSSDANALQQGKIASTKNDYIIEPLKIRRLHQFWKDVDNNVMKDIEFDEETFADLPHNAVSPDVFLVENNELTSVPQVEKNSTIKPTLGGASLLRSAEEELEATMISCTVTIAENKEDQHEQLARLLPSINESEAAPPSTNSNTFVVRPAQQFVNDSDQNYLETRYPDLFPFGRGGFGEKRKIRISKKTLVAYYVNLSSRQFQKTDFALPIYDLIARTASSNMAIIRAKLPSRSFNTANDRVPRAEAYGRIAIDDLRKAATYQNQCVRAKKYGQKVPRPPESLNGLASSFFTDQQICNQTIQHSQAAAQHNRLEVYAAHANNGKAQIWLTISPDDAKSYHVAWFALGPEQAKPLKDDIPLGSKRFTILAEHPVAAALEFERVLDIVLEEIVGWSKQEGRPFKHGGLFGVPKAWLRVVEEQSRLTLHFHMLIWLYGHEAIEDQLAAALKLDSESNEEVANPFHGFSSTDQDSGVRTNTRPDNSDLDQSEAFTTPFYGFLSTSQDTEMENSSIFDVSDAEQCESNSAPFHDVSSMVQNTQIESRDIASFPYVAEQLEANSTQVQGIPSSTKNGNILIDGERARNSYVESITDKLARNIDCFMQGELKLPEEEMLLLLHCSSCPTEKLEIASATRLEKMREPGTQNETQILCCRKCNEKSTVTTKMEAALQHGYSRLHRQKPSDQDIDNLLWRTLRKRPLPVNQNEVDLWLLDFACIQMRVNFHDWRHRKSCFKSGRKTCRYGIPPNPTTTTQVKAIYESEKVNDEGNTDVQTQKNNIVELQIDVQKRVPFIFFTDCNSDIMSVLNCNNCTRYVKNQKVSLYYGAYTTKHNTDCEQALAEAVSAIEKHGEKIIRQQQKADADAEANQYAQEEDPTFAIHDPQPRRSDFSIGLGKLLSGVRASTNGETIGGPLAAFVLRGNLIFDMSHKTAVLPLAQAVSYLCQENMYAAVNRFGEVKATTHDYVFRSDQTEDIENMNLWDFVKTQEICKLKPDTEESLVDDFAVGPQPAKGRLILRFTNQHPQHATQGHRPRTVQHWPKYLAKRIPDLNDLNDTSCLLPEEREEKRTEYAKAILTMFIPFRDISDLVMEGETWWDSYSRQKHYLYSNKTTKQVIDSIQNFYESFCRSTPEAAVIGLTENDLQHFAEEENEGTEEHEIETINMADIEELGEQNEESVSDEPFVAALASLPENPMDLTMRHWPPLVSYHNAKTAIHSLPKATGKKFVLPGRASLPLSVEESNPTLENPEIDTYLDRPQGTRVELLDHLAAALDHHLHQDVPSDRTQPKKLEQNFPTLQEQSRHWTLNKEQHYAFLLMGSSLLQHIHSTNQLSTLELNRSMTTKIDKINSYLGKILPHQQQLVMFLAGSGGTGKSRVIKCFTDFCRRWNSVASKVVCASSGVAAILIEGSTLHSALGIGIYKIFDPTPDQIAAWSEVGVLILDEFSMLQSKLLDIMEERMRKLKCQPDKPFGGVHVIFCGDFYQLAPVGGGPVYPHRIDLTNKICVQSAKARDFWKTCLTDVIELKTNHRQLDVNWATALEHFRINQPTRSDIDLVLSRYMFGNQSISNPPKGTIIAVPLNKQRELALRFGEKRLLETLPPILDQSDWRRQGVLLVKAKISPKNAKDTISSQDQEYVRKLGSKILKCSGNLYCIVDAPYIVTANTDLSKGISNGTLCFLKDIVLKPNARITVESVGNGRKVHSVSADHVECLIFKHKSSSWNNSNPFTTLPQGCFPIVPQSHSLNCMFSKQRQIKVKTFQFRTVLSIVLTGHKTQGLTVNSIILGSINNTHRSGLTGWLYVILSRVKTIEGLFLMEKIEQDPAKYKMRIDVQTEMIRLRTIQSQTIARLLSADFPFL